MNNNINKDFYYYKLQPINNNIKKILGLCDPNIRVSIKI